MSQDIVKAMNDLYGNVSFGGGGGGGGGGGNSHPACTGLRNNQRVFQGLSNASTVAAFVTVKMPPAAMGFAIAAA